jgi:SH3 domain protein
MSTIQPRIARDRRDRSRGRIVPRPLPALVAVLVLSASAASLNAQSLYVSDELVITLRTGPSTENAIVRNLRSGDVVTVLEEDADAGYARVRAADGTEGWVLRQYLTDAPIARSRLEASERNLAEARQRVAVLESRVDELTEQLDAATQRLQEAETAASDLNSELVDVRSASADALTIRDQNQSLRRRLNDRDQLVNELTAQNAALASRANREWFVVGAGVLVTGIVLGLIIPSLRRKRRSGW